MAYDEAVSVSHGPIAIVTLSFFAFPFLALVGFVAGLWTWRTHVGKMRLLLLAAITALYWHEFGRSMVKLLTGGFA
jgi:hypothetical protein